MSQVEGSSKLANIGETADTLEQLKRRSRFTLFIAWLALFFTVIGIAAGYKNWMQINDRAKEAAHGVAELREKSTKFADKTSVLALNTKLLDELEQGRESLSQSVEILDDVKKASQHAVDTIEKQAELLTFAQEQSHPKSSNPSIQWRVAELRFLLRIADQRLQLNKDKMGALQALRSAETTLLKIGSRKYLSVRKKLAKNIVALELYLVPNISAISQRIADLIEVIDAMPVTGEIKNSNRVMLLPETKSDDDGFLSRVIDGINDAVVIRKFDKSVQKTIGLDAKEKLHNLLHLRLETLRLMALHGLDKDYHRQLKLIKQTLEKYYPEMINDTLQKHLQALEKVNLSVTPPDISGSLKLLEQISTQKTRAKKTSNTQ